MRASRSAFQELNDLRIQMSRLVESESTYIWSPVVDVSENEQAIIVEAELPGMRKEEIEIHLHDGTLTLRGERKIESAKAKERFHRMERQYGAWQRVFQFEIPIDGGRASADSSPRRENGALSSAFQPAWPFN